MASSFFFYDLETSGFSPREARIMQFAGQRTDADLKPIGQPVNVLIKLTADILPDPDAVLLTGITPQQTLADGVTEAEFLKQFHDELLKPDTIFMGYNSVRFDDEFMRYLFYRNFYDPYEWHWKDGCSRWDLLDLVRMTRALRPDGIEWPFAPDGRPANRLEFLTKVNKLDHDHAHDALSDVRATIAVANLIKTKQPDLFNYLLQCRDKKEVKKLVLAGRPFVYTSGRYASEFLHTTVAVEIAKHTVRDEVLVYDLRFDPTPFMKLSVNELVEAWRFTKDPQAVRLPVKTIKYNRCPAVAPLGVIKDDATQERLKLSLTDIQKHLGLLKQGQAEFAHKLTEAVKQLDAERERQQTALIDNETTVDSRLYDGFFGDADRRAMAHVRSLPPAELSVDAVKFQDNRLAGLLPLYKARNYSQVLTDEERKAWDDFCAGKLFGGGKQSRLAAYFGRLGELAADDKLTDAQRYLLEELQLYGESIVPADAAA